MDRRYGQRWYKITDPVSGRFTEGMPVSGGVLVLVTEFGQDDEKRPPPAMTSTFVPDVCLLEGPKKTEHVEADEDEGDPARKVEYREVCLVGNRDLEGLLSKGWKRL